MLSGCTAREESAREKGRAAEEDFPGHGLRPLARDRVCRERARSPAGGLLSTPDIFRQPPLSLAQAVNTQRPRETIERQASPTASGHFSRSDFCAVTARGRG